MSSEAIQNKESYTFEIEQNYTLGPSGSLILTAVGAILALGCLATIGFLATQGYQMVDLTMVIPMLSILAVTGCALSVLGIHAHITEKERALRVHKHLFHKQAEKNLRKVVKHHSLDYSRFIVIGTKSEPILKKISGVRSLLRSLFVSKREMEDQLQQALNASVTVLNEMESLSDEQKILGAKYNRFISTSKLLTSMYYLEEMENCEHTWGKFSRSVLSNNDAFVQPIYKKGKWFHMEHQANHSLEAIAIFFETQLKRVSRWLTGGRYCKYFSQDETEKQIYKKDAPSLHSKRPVVHNIGHATLLFQMDCGLNVLTDPVFGDLNPLLYPRITQPGLSVEEMPPIDVVLISHNHRDHCDLDSLRALVPHQPHLLVPYGDYALFRDLGFEHVTEHHWWTTTTIECGNESVKFHAVPAKHWSGRGACDAHESLICSWVFHQEGRDGAVYFRGDTADIPEAYTDDIKDFVGVPIVANFEPGGPNHTRKWMESTHQSVLDSMLSCFEVTDTPEECKTFLMHHNAYELGTDRFNEAVFIKNQILSYLRGELQEEQLPEFVREELKAGKLNRIDNIIGRERFIKHMERHFLSPKIGERVTLPSSLYVV